MEATATATPDAQLPPEDDATPDAPEQGGEPGDSGAAADQPPAAAPDPRLAQAEYTRSQQAFSRLRDELGLDRSATREDVIAEVQRLREGYADDGDDFEDEEEPDPRLTEALEIAWNAKLETASAIYGEDFTQQGLDLINYARQVDDPVQLFSALAAFRDAWSGGTTVADAGTQGGEDGGDAADPDAVPAPIGAGEPDQGPSSRKPISESAARREPGTVDAIRGIFEGLGINSRNREGRSQG